MQPRIKPRVSRSGSRDSASAPITQTPSQCQSIFNGSATAQGQVTITYGISLYRAVGRLDSSGYRLHRLLDQKGTKGAMLGSNQAVIFVAVGAALELLRNCALVDLASVSGRHLHLLKASLALSAIEGTLVAELSAHANDRHRMISWTNRYKNSLPRQQSERALTAPRCWRTSEGKGVGRWNLHS